MNRQIMAIAASGAVLIAGLALVALSLDPWMQIPAAAVVLGGSVALANSRWLWRLAGWTVAALGLLILSGGLVHPQRPAPITLTSAATLRPPAP